MVVANEKWINIIRARTYEKCPKIDSTAEQRRCTYVNLIKYAKKEKRLFMIHHFDEIRIESRRLESRFYGDDDFLVSSYWIHS